MKSAQPPVGPGQIDKDIADWFNRHWSPKMGAVDGHDIAFLAALIDRDRPARFVEIGCASGLSTSVIAMLMTQIAGAKLSSFDLGETFYADPDKKVGYLLDSVARDRRAEVEISTGCTSLDVRDRIDGAIDMCFIDAAHTHPWPLIDTLAILPLMKPGAVIVHHDLQMMRGQPHFALGPKILFDQLAEADRVLVTDVVKPGAAGAMKTRGITQNIFGMRVARDHRLQAARLADGFLVGWDKAALSRLPAPFLDRFTAFLGETYDQKVADTFAIARHRYVAPPAPPAPPATLGARIRRRLARQLRRGRVTGQ